MASLPEVRTMTSPNTMRTMTVPARDWNSISRLAILPVYSYWRTTWLKSDCFERTAFPLCRLMLQEVTRTKPRSPTTQARKRSRAMNWLHHRICSSPTWRRKLESDLLPWALQDVSLGSELLELGPGFGFTTAFLHARTANLTTVEVHHAFAKRLLQCFRGTNVRVVEADAAALPFADCSFSAAACFTMLHHHTEYGTPGSAFSKRLPRLAPPGCILRN